MHGMSLLLYSEWQQARYEVSSTWYQAIMPQIDYVGSTVTNRYEPLARQDQ